MKVKMLQNVTGTRNAENWPSAGQIAEFPDAEAEDLVAAGIAQRTTDKTTYQWRHVPVVIETATDSPVENAAVK